MDELLDKFFEGWNSVFNVNVHASLSKFHKSKDLFTFQRKDFRDNLKNLFENIFLKEYITNLLRILSNFAITFSRTLNL